jgi:hypothetical protein
MNSVNRIHRERFLVLSAAIAVAVLALAMAAYDAAPAHASTAEVAGVGPYPGFEQEIVNAAKVKPNDGQLTSAEVVLARADANDQASPLGDRKDDSPDAMVGSSPLIPVEQRITVPDKGSVFVKGLYLDANVTFYDCVRQGFCEEMYNGSMVYEGAAACSWDLPLGTRFYIPGDPTNRIYVCEDRGRLEDTWVDIFWHHPSDGRKWQHEVGRYAPIILIE